MRFEVLPSIIRKVVGLKGEVTTRTLSFDALLKTDPFSLQGGSTLQDGRKLSSLSCTTFIRAIEAGTPESSLHFVAAYSAEDLGIRQPDCLQLDVYLAPATFDELWQAARDGARLLLGGQVDALPSKFRYGPGLAPFEWDVGPKDNRTKPVSEFWFTILAQSAPDAEPVLMRLRAEADGQAASQLIGKQSALIEEKYAERTQMRRLCLMALKQTEQETMRRGLTGWDAKSLLDEAIDLVETAHRAVRTYDPVAEEDEKTKPQEFGELWKHKNVVTFFQDGRAALGRWSVNQDELAGVVHGLLQRPWLRIDELEWLIVDALTFHEVFEFGEATKQNNTSFILAWAYAKSNGNLRKLRWERLKTGAFWWIVRWGLVATGMWGTWSYVEGNHYSGLHALGILGGSLLILLWLLIGFPVGRAEQRRQESEKAQLLAKMHDAYTAMRLGGSLSPYQIRAALLAAQEKGAMWSTAAFALLDRAAKRDAGVWILY